MRKFAHLLIPFLIAIFLAFLDRFLFTAIREERISLFSSHLLLLRAFEGLIVASTLAILALTFILFKIGSKKEIFTFALSSWLIIFPFPPIVSRLFVYLSPSGGSFPPHLISYAILLQPYFAFFLSGIMGSLVLAWSDAFKRWLWGGLIGFLSFYYFSLSDYIHIFEKGLDSMSLLIATFFSLSTGLGGLIGGFISDKLAEKFRKRCQGFVE
ncbi:MAG: hypothetical protein ACP5KZ_09635 [bacterium]